MKLIVITGGIGSGKSVVSRVLTSMGHHVYDCDSRAKALMDTSVEIKEAIRRDVCREAITDEGSIDRKCLAAKVFSDKEALLRLNAIVHGAVRDDIARWVATLHNATTAWIETAIARESGILDMADEVWLVTAPDDLRIRRVMARNNMTAKQVADRMRSQNFENLTDGHSHLLQTIVNDERQPLLPQVLALLDR